MGARQHALYQFLGGNWAEIILNEHAMLLEIDGAGAAVKVNRLLENHTGIASAGWFGSKNWRQRVQGIEHGREVDVFNRVKFGQIWKGLVKITDADGQVFLTHATAVPCLDAADTLFRLTILMNPTDVTYISGVDEGRSAAQTFAFNFSRTTPGEQTYRISRIAAIGGEPVDIVWPDELNAIRESITAQEDHFFTFILNSVPSMPVRFRINPQIFKSLLPSLLRTSISATRYGIIHVTVEPVKLPETGTALRFRVEDTGERIGSTSDRSVKRPSGLQGMYSELASTRDLFDICDAELFYRSDESGNIFEFMAQIEILEPAKKDSVGVKILDSWPEMRFYREMSADTFKVKAFEELSFSELLGEQMPATAEEAAFWIHSQRPAIFYLGNEALAEELREFEKKLRNDPPKSWQTAFLSYRENLLNWMHTVNS